MSRSPTAWTGGDEAARETARRTLRDVSLLALTHFPQTLPPNRLVNELRALARGAGLQLPFVDELAADIFMGTFADNFLRAGKMAGQLLRGSLYERYFDIPYDKVLQINDVQTPTRGPGTSPAFDALCRARAGSASSASFVVANGRIIEQAQIITTHNLAALYVAMQLGSDLQPRMGALARQTLEWIFRRLQLRMPAWKTQLRNVKNCAYAWRQMIFYISLAGEAEIAHFLEEASTLLQAQRPEFRLRFEPALEGLKAVAAGARFDADGGHAGGGQRLLGWSETRHWLLPPKAAA